MKSREKHSGNSGKKQPSSQLFARQFQNRSGEWDANETRKPHKIFKHSYLEFKRGLLDDDATMESGEENAFDHGADPQHADAAANPISH